MSSEAGGRTRGRARRELPSWPFVLLFAAYPLWWILGLAGGLIWPLMSVPMLLALVLSGRIRMPRGFGIWLLFMLWMTASAIELDNSNRLISFLFRAGMYVAPTVLFLYVYNASPQVLPVRKVALALTALWVTVVVGGYLGLAFPNVSVRTPVEMVLPQSLLGNSFVHDLVHPGFAQVVKGSNGDLVRPKAPFTYTNAWGGSFAVLVPFVLMALATSRPGPQRNLIRLLLPIALVPALLSLNRGLFISLGIGLVYAALRLVVRGRVRALVGVIALLGATVALVTALPVQQRLEDRISTSETNDTRLALYREAVDRSLKSPVLGYGAPRPSDESPGSPSVGTQGQIWSVLFSHGFPGLALFLGWHLWALWHTRGSETATRLWAHVAVLIATLQLVFYGTIPVQLGVMMIATALCLRETGASAAARRRRVAQRPIATAPSSESSVVTRLSSFSSSQSSTRSTDSSTSSWSVWRTISGSTGGS